MYGFERSDSTLALRGALRSGRGWCGVVVRGVPAHRARTWAECFALRPRPGSAQYRRRNAEIAFLFWTTEDTARAIGARFGLSGSRASQICGSVLRWLCWNGPAQHERDFERVASCR